MAVTICVINSKGGCGKTTIATHLAAALSSSGLVTALADWDRHRGATHWLSLRPKTAARIAHADWRRKFGAYPVATQRVVIDCPAALKSKRVRDVVAEADVIVVPLLPSVFDEYVTRQFLAELDDIKKIRKGRAAVLLVANRTRAGSARAAQMRSFLADLGHEPAIFIADRNLYPSLAARGLTVFDRETASMQARQEEWMPLIAEIERVARGRNEKATNEAKT
jgi:chromosome partitioning protein